jgi:hypothetical protein
VPVTLSLLSTLLSPLLSQTALADEPPEDGFSLGALPALNYNSDEGFGYGVIGTGYWYRDGLMPYKYALTARIFLTTKKVHAHMLRLDALDVGGLPLRVWAEGGYSSTLTANFCGYAGEGYCGADAESVAEAAGVVAGLSGEELDSFVSHYYQLRYTEPYGLFNLRWRLKDLPHKVEAMVGYRGSYYFPGTPADDTPWPGSLYQSSYYTDGETGFSSVVQGGMMFDNRDNEPAPNSGYWSEVSVRGSAPWLGSTWSWSGVNLTHRQYATLVPDRLVSASRVVLDATWGDLPVAEISRFGGSRDYSGLGGQYGGRGMRAWRYLGQVKALGQQELRYTFLKLAPGTQTLDFGVVGFFDYGYAARDFSDLSASDSGYGTGAGLRVTWNENFIVRVDSGFSPIEDWGNKLYINLDHIF